MTSPHQQSLGVGKNHKRAPFYCNNPKPDSPIAHQYPQQQIDKLLDMIGDWVQKCKKENAKAADTTTCKTTIDYSVINKLQGASMACNEASFAFGKATGKVKQPTGALPMPPIKPVMTRKENE